MHVSFYDGPKLGSRSPSAHSAETSADLGDSASADFVWTTLGQARPISKRDMMSIQTLQLTGPPILVLRDTTLRPPARQVNEVVRLGFAGLVSTNWTGFATAEGERYRCAIRRSVMLSPGILYTTAALMALVAIACTALCLAWSIPGWRRRLAPAGGAVGGSARDDGLTGWPAGVGSGVISAGIGACALLAWYGAYCTLVAV
jgi:hypothetical protein